MALNRALIEHDVSRFEALAMMAIDSSLSMETLGPRIEAAVMAAPLPLGPSWVRRRLAAALQGLAAHRLRESLQSIVSQSLRAPLSLEDGELEALIAGVGRELGAWYGTGEPLTDDELAGLVPIVAHMGATAEDPLRVLEAAVSSEA